MSRNLEEPKHGESRVCVVCAELAGNDILQDDNLCVVALAQRLAQAGGNVTILWVPRERPKAEEIERAVAQYRDNYSITVELYSYNDEMIYNSNLATHVSLGLYTYLKNNRYSTAYMPLEAGMAYYTLLGKETGVYSGGPKINLIASAPLEWTSNADRFFFWSIEQLRIDFMEKYCAQQADKVICTSVSLRDWMLKNKWKIGGNCETLPALIPNEWKEQFHFDEDVPIKGSREIVLIASPRFRDGMTLFCDALDHLSKSFAGDLTVTVLGGFYHILGEHTGGMFVRRGRRWGFRLRFLRNSTLRQGMRYAKEVGAVAVIPNFENTGGYGVAECIRLGVPFVATAVGGNVQQVDFFKMAHCLVKPEAKALATAILQKLKRPVPSTTNKFEDQKSFLWLKALTRTKKGESSDKLKIHKKPPSPLVSVVMTHHDRPQYFLQALESVKLQNYPNFEVIVVDDGSLQPQSHAMLDGLKSEFRRRKWKLIKTENRYVGAARNTGVRASRGKFVVFVDDDNALLPEAISTFVSAITRSNSDVCTALSRNFYGDHVPGSSRFNYVGWIPLGAAPDVSFFECCFGDTISIYRRTVFDKVGYQVEKFGYMVEDYEFFVRIMLSGLKMRLIPEPLFWYRVSTQGRYRSSHYHDNHLPILEAFSKAKFKGLDNLYKLALGQNISTYAKESYRVNLTYSPSDREFLELSKLDPNSSDAVSLLAKLAAAESRPDTAIGLLASLGGMNLENGLDGILNENVRLSPAAMAHVPVFTSIKTLGVNDILAMQVSFEERGSTQPKSYVEQPGRLFLETVNGTLSVAVLPAGVPAYTTSVTCRVSAPTAKAGEVEFLLLLSPMHQDPIIAVHSAEESQLEPNSGWVPLGAEGVSKELSARFSAPSLAPSNLVLALRSRRRDTRPVLGCFDAISYRTAIEEKVGRPRLGSSQHDLVGRTWTNAERLSAKLATMYPAELPLLLFPKDLEDGIFLRPSTYGPVIAVIDRGFPAFGQRLLGQVEIAHENASSFEFAVALTLPGQELQWAASGPKNSIAFSGWVRVEDRFKLQDISLKLMELMSEPLTISLAIKLPRGSSPAPANAFWRNLKFF
ncbi:MAG: DUF6212 domain-containing protein [Aestuariivirga sp.]